MSFYRIRPRAGTATQWELANPVLGEREMGVEMPPEGIGKGPVKIKFGDGSTPWNDLPYGVTPPEIDISDLVVQTLDGEETNKVPSVAAVKNALQNAGGGIQYIHGETDEIQILGDDGEWHRYDSGGLNDVYLYREGEFNTDLLTTINPTGDTSYIAITFNENHISCVITVGSVWHEFGWIGREAFDVTDFNKLSFDYSISATKAIEDYNVRIGLSTTNTNTYSSTYSAESVLLAVGETNASGTATINCSGLSGVFYLTSDFRMSVPDGLTITLNISNIKLRR